MTDKEFYNCSYCFKEFEPKRRRVQKYCSDTCRSKAYHVRKTKVQTPKSKLAELSVPNNIPTPKKESMSMTGVGNAAAGTLLANTLKSALTKDSNKPATKGDLSQLLEKLNNRYHLIKNMNPNFRGEYPYFDLVDSAIVYLPINNM
jgi:hypothetical protein